MADTSFTVQKDKLEVTTERVFKASAVRLFKAHTDAQDIPQWWGPSGLKTVVDKLEPKVGGAWRFVQTDPTGKEYAFNGIFKEIDEQNKIVQTFEYEGMPGHVLIQTVTFEEQTDGTKVTSTAKFDNIEDLEGMVAMDMESGEREGFERLATLTKEN